jgi:VIT1/CCC1 family predicted Fe2+/Mn2+ transporter
MAKPDDLPRYRSNLQGEIDGAAVYAALAESESDPKLAEVFRRLAAVEQAHGDFWRKQIEAKGARFAPAPSRRARILAWLARRFGPAFVLPTLAGNETRDSAAYDSQPEARKAGLPSDERSHARLMMAVAGADGLAGPTLAMLEGRHRGGGNTLRAAVLGANDGLVSNLSLVMGVAGAQLQNRAIVITGLAGLLAGACSMAMGEYVSVQSARELAQRQIGIEADEIDEAPEEEREELALIYEAKGLSPDEARTVAGRMMADRSTALETLTREELGLDPDVLTGSPYVAAGASFLLFAMGAIVPLIAFLVTTGTLAAVISIASAAVGLFAIGAAITLLTGRSALFSGTRQLILGLLAAAVTFGIGRLIGVSVS